MMFQERDFLLEQGIQVMDFAMADSRNLPSPYAQYFVSTIDYRSETGRWDNLKQGVKFVHSGEAVKKIEQIICKERPDIAHLHNIYHQLTPSVIPVLKKYGIKIVLTLHDGKLICPTYLMLNRKGNICTECAGRYFWKPMTQKCKDSLTHRLLLMFEAYWHKWKRSYEAVDLFIAPSRFIADLISQRIPKEKITVLHNGIDVTKFSPNYQDEGYALYFGRLSKEKGVETLLKAHKAVSDILPLKIVGTGPIERQLCSSYPKAEFMGYKQGKELIDIISKSAFVVVPSEGNENCSMVVLESMAMGKPIIGSRIGGIPEQISDGISGLLFEMGSVKELSQKMRFLSGDSQLRIELGRAARKKAETAYSLKIHCYNLLKIYEELIDGVEN